MALAYSSLTVREAVDEVMLRMKQSRTAANMDYGTVLKMLQESRRNLAAILLPFKEYALIKSVAVTHAGSVPADFIKPVRAILQAGVQEFVEARYVDPREYDELTNATRAHSFAGASATAPVYMVWANAVTTSPAWAESQMDFWCFPTTMTGTMEYIAAYGDTDMDTEAELVNVPAETENLLINLALERCYFRIGEQNKMVAAYTSIQNEIAGMRARLAAKNQTEAIDIQSLINVEPTQVPPTGGKK